MKVATFGFKTFILQFDSILVACKKTNYLIWNTFGIMYFINSSKENPKQDRLSPPKRKAID